MIKYTAVLSFIFLIGCQQNKVDQINTPQELPKSNEKENVELVKKYFGYFNQHDWESMAGLYVDSARFKDPSLGSGIVVQSRQEIIDKYFELHQIFSDVNDSIVAIYPSGETNVIVEFISTGTAPDGSGFELPICTIFTIEGSRITADFTYYDNF